MHGHPTGSLPDTFQIHDSHMQQDMGCPHVGEGAAVCQAQGLAKATQLVQGSSGAEVGVLPEPPMITQAAPR